MINILTEGGINDTKTCNLTARLAKQGFYEVIVQVKGFDMDLLQSEKHALEGLRELVRDIEMFFDANKD